MNVTILGAGAYALALAYRFCEKNNVIMWSAIKEEIDDLTKTRKNPNALDVTMPEKVKYTSDIEEALKKCDIVVIAVSTKYVKNVCITIKKYINDKIIVITSKGIEQESLMFASMIVKHILKSKKVCTLSGPSFAIDMIDINNIIGLSLAATNKTSREIVKNAISSNTLKIRCTDDFIGVELCGAMKNVVAIASGIIDGLNACDSTKAMFLTECINDVRHLIKKLGGNEKTILSFAGIGDILLTSSSKTSRNFQYGKMVGDGFSKDSLDAFLKQNTVEGVYTLVSIYKIIRSKRIKLPFLELIYNILVNGLDSRSILSFMINKE